MELETRNDEEEEGAFYGLEVSALVTRCRLSVK